MKRRSIAIASFLCLAMIFTTVFASFAETTQSGETDEKKSEQVQDNSSNTATSNDSGSKAVASAKNGVTTASVLDNKMWVVNKDNGTPKEIKPENALTADKGDVLFVIIKKDAGLLSNSKFTKVDITTVESALDDEDLSLYPESDYYFYKVDTSTVNLSGFNVTVGAGTDAKTYTFKVKMPKGWYEEGGKKYYYKADGTKYVNTFASVDKKTYNFDSNGAVLYGANKYKNGSYYFSNADGVVVTNKGYVSDEDGNQYYVQKGGKLIRSAMYSAHYYDSSCKMLKRQILNYKGNLYFIDNAGKIKTTAGWATLNNVKYRVKKGGKLYRYTKAKISGSYYIFDSNGKRLDGKLITFKGNRYYSWSNGMLKTNGWITINGKTYCASAGGEFYHNRFVTGYRKAYYLNTDGSVVKREFKYKGVTVTPDSTTGVVSWANYERAIYANSPYSYNDYVLIDISSQTLTYYKNYRLVLKTGVVTGGPGHATPRGKFKVVEKNTNIYLTGPGYKSYVKRWMGFVGSSVGMHDASWRGTFGGSIYKNNGSHGCVNMPYAAASSLYSRVTKGKTIVIVRY